ncbi:MAG TPA: sugar-transfer associated ATP-grasp domain-containing protein, partial [Nordella sp.]|nr:sugar-transfer associated ATP-grasp domain-containing protein [Nordella sp.]
THHPDTGAAIEGRVLHFWPETIALACRAHAAFAPRVFIGWDIAITSNGPVLIEGNGAPGIDLIQRAYREPAGNSRLGELFAFHLRNDPETMALIGDAELAALAPVMDEPVDMAAGDADIGQHGIVGAAQPPGGAPAVDRPRYTP